MTKIRKGVCFYFQKQLHSHPWAVSGFAARPIRMNSAKLQYQTLTMEKCGTIFGEKQILFSNLRKLSLRQPVVHIACNMLIHCYDVDNISD